MVAMRDGVQLYTVAFIPIDLKKKKFDTVMIRTPYGTDGLKGEGETYIKSGFAAVMQDFRGRYKSKGEFECWLNASTDATDTLHWIVSQPWSSSAVFQQGTSAPGLATYFAEVGEQSPQILRALFPVVATAELHKTIYQGGAYRHSLINGWLNAIGEPAFEINFTTNEGETYFWNNVTMTDKWARVTAPAVHLTGWYDIFNQQQIDAYTAFQTESTFGRGANFLVIMPTGHCAGGQVAWPGAGDGYTFANELSLAMFKALGTGDDKAAAAAALAVIPPLWFYVMGPGLPGSIGNFWANGSAFPSTRDLVLYASGTTLSPAAPTQATSREFVYNPLSPVPTLGGNNLLLPQCGPWDQSKLETRSDVLTFTSDPLPAAIAVVGHMRATLFVSSNCSDTDFTAKVTDVFPNGTSLLVQDGIVRMRWRNGGTQPDLLTPGDVYEADIDIWSTSYIFNQGHAIRLVVSSSNYPRFSANPNTGKPLVDTSRPLFALNTVVAGPTLLSRLVLPVVSSSDIVPAKLPQLRF